MREYFCIILELNSTRSGCGGDRVKYKHFIDPMSIFRESSCELNSFELIRM